MIEPITAAYFSWGGSRAGSQRTPRSKKKKEHWMPSGLVVG